MTATTALETTAVTTLTFLILAIIHAYIGNSECCLYQLFCFIVTNQKPVFYFISSFTSNHYGNKKLVYAVTPLNVRRNDAPSQARKRFAAYQSRYAVRPTAEQ